VLADGCEQTAFFLRQQVMNRKATPGGIGRLRPLNQGLDEVFVVELDLEGFYPSKQTLLGGVWMSASLIGR